MRMNIPMFAVILIFAFFEKYTEGSDSSSGNNEETASIPIIASGKRQHNIMRFGKRLAGGHNLIHFGKRGESKAPQHSFLSFGKRMDDQEALPDLIQYLQKARDNSYKRGHTIMRFGKRAPSSHNFIRFGRGDGDGDYEEYYGSDDGQMDADKRGGHNMMYFGKRGGHSMLYFGKRAAGHKIMSFGKRGNDEGDDSLIPLDEDEGDDNLSPEEKRAHSMIHFGKREDEDDLDPEEIKRASHSMIHFGKREFDDEPLPYWNPTTYEKKQHNLLRFGKKTDGIRRGGSHAMIHFGKRDEDKRAHSMIHFGKRSIDQNTDSSSPKNQSANTPTQPLTRMKREVEEPIANVEPLVALIRYGNNEEDEISTEEELENAIKSSPNMYHSREILNDLLYPEDVYSDFQPTHKKDASKNVFLRFG